MIKVHLSYEDREELTSTVVELLSLIKFEPFSHEQILSERLRKFIEELNQ